MTNSLNNTPHIIIVGGGTAGWMAAAMLSHHMTPQQCRVTIVDSNEGGIGVGEATIPSILRLLRTLRADEAEFMRSCGATWKLGIQFANWLRPEHDFWHPFGVCGAVIDGGDLFPFWLANAQQSEEATRPYHAYSLHWAAMLAGKTPHSAAETLSPITSTGSYAFHLDAIKLAEWLKSRALAAGVQHIADRVVSCERNEAGDIISVQLDNDGTQPGDFFVDCSGFQSVLAQGDDWIDWSDQLLCDRAVALSLPPRAVIPSHTKASALSAGWCWDIPLMTRRGLGYVYSSRHLSADDAAVELRSFAKVRDNDDVAIRQLSMKVGRREQIWKGNVLSLGLAAGFTEPLESTGLHLIQVGLEQWLKLFPAQPISPVLQDAYNTRMTRIFDEVRDFVQLHYHLNQRSVDDDPHGFWQASRDAEISDQQKHRLKLYDEIGRLPAFDTEAFGDANYYFILSDNDRLPRRPTATAIAAGGERITFVLQAILDQNRNALRDLPLHEDRLKQVHDIVAKAS